MLFAACVKHVITRESHVRIDSGRAWIHDEDASWELNEPDAYALEAALRLREAHGGEVLVVSAGPERVTHVLREALARGADRAIHVAGDHLAASDSATTATALAAALAPHAPDLVLTGLQSDDQGLASVGVMLAARLDRPHVTMAMAIEVAEGRVRLKRELESGWFQWISMPLPAVVTVQSGINQLRYATLKGIMAAKRKPIETVEAPRAEPPRARIVGLRLPERSKSIRLLTGAPADAASALVRALRDEARVLPHG